MANVHVLDHPPVSYTHLQKQRMLKWTLYVLPGILLLTIQDVIMSRVSIFGATPDLPVVYILLITVIEGVDAVSYTHLDVYKRQILQLPLICAVEGVGDFSVVIEHAVHEMCIRDRPKCLLINNSLDLLLRCSDCS